MDSRPARRLGEGEGGPPMFMLAEAVYEHLLNYTAKKGGGRRKSEEKQEDRGR